MSKKELHERYNHLRHKLDHCQEHEFEEIERELLEVACPLCTEPVAGEEVLPDAPVWACTGACSVSERTAIGTIAIEVIEGHFIVPPPSVQLLSIHGAVPIRYGTTTQALFVASSLAPA